MFTITRGVVVCQCKTTATCTISSALYIDTLVITYDVISETFVSVCDTGDVKKAIAYNLNRMLCTSIDTVHRWYI